MNVEADQAVQEARFAGACQDQHAGRPAPNLGWPGERKSIVQQPETSRQGPGGRGLQALGARAQEFWAPGQEPNSHLSDRQGVGDG